LCNYVRHRDHTFTSNQIKQYEQKLRAQRRLLVAQLPL
jgi:hypothetical protein